MLLKEAGIHRTICEGTYDDTVSDLFAYPGQNDNKPLTINIKKESTNNEETKKNNIVYYRSPKA